MRFLFISEFLPRWNSGAEGTLLAAGDALERRGNRVDYIWKDPNHGYLLHPRFYEYFTLPDLQMKRVDRALSRTKYDVVIVSQPYGYPIFEKLVRKYPDVVFLNRTHGWEERLAAACLKFQLRSANSLTKPLRDLSETLMARACRRTARACSGFIASSHLCADYVRARHSLHPDAVAVIPYGADQSIARSPVRAEVPRSTRLLYVGQYLPRKGSRVMEAVLPGIAHLNPRTEMTFVVPEDSVESIRAFYTPHFGHRVTVRPWVSREVLSGIYQENDVLLFPSLFEGFGKVFLEGMASGLCVAGYREGGLPDIATNGRDALICELGDTAAFGGMLQQALNDPKRTREIGLRARDSAKHFTWDRHARETEDFCLSLKYGPARAAIAS